jgi:26S proteasome regulatory subunit N11
MGELIGEIVDDYTIKVVDVFSMPQTASSVSVESVDSVYQQQMYELLKVTGRMENCIGWYHSHPSYGCWLSSGTPLIDHPSRHQHPAAVRAT